MGAGASRGLKADKATADELFKKADTDQNGVLSLDELQPGTTYHVQCLGEEGAHGHEGEWSRYTPSRPYVEGDPEFEALRGCRVVHCLPQSIVVVGSGQGHTQCTTRAVHLPSVHG